MAAKIPAAGISTYNAATSDADLGSGIHIKSADSGLSSIAAGADELVIEGSGDSGMHILSGASNDGNIFFGDSGDADNAYITYDHSTNHLHIGHGALTKSNAMLIFHGSDLTLGTNSETSPDTSRGGLCLNQGGTDGNILTFKSSDVAHGRTSVAETDTYAEFGKGGSNDGGLAITTINDAGNISFYLDAHARANDTGKGTGDHGCMNFDANTHDGSGGGTSLSTNANMVTFSNDNSVRFIFDAEGDIHVDGSSSISTYDAYEDAQLVRAYDLSHGKGVIASQFDKFVQYNKDDLTDVGLVGRVNHKILEDGTEAKPLINMTGFVRLHNGAIWQQYEKHEKLANAMYELAKAAVGEDKANEILEQNDIKLLN